MSEIETKEVKEGTDSKETETKENKVDVEKVKKGAIASLLEELGLRYRFFKRNCYKV